MVRRRIVTVSMALVAVVAAVACEPPPPTPVFQVNSYEADGDADPGDGVCETAPGNGECTITAAVEEGNALGTAVIDYPVHTDPSLEFPLAVPTITGDITLRSGFFIYENLAASAFATNLTVTPNATLRLEGFSLVVREDLLVEGAMLIDRSALWATTTIAEGGAVLAVNSTVDQPWPATPPMFTNAGTLVLRYIDIYTNDPFLHTEPGATSIIGASLIEAPEGACTGEAVVSEGYNIDWTGVEVEGEDGTDEYVGGCTPESPYDVEPQPEAIPYGVLGCGTTVVVDNLGNPRPFDDDDDGIALCGIGAMESRPWFPWTPPTGL